MPGGRRRSSGPSGCPAVPAATSSPEAGPSPLHRLAGINCASTSALWASSTIAGSSSSPGTAGSVIAVRKRWPLNNPQPARLGSVAARLASIFDSAGSSRTSSMRARSSRATSRGISAQCRAVDHHMDSLVQAGTRDPLDRTVQAGDLLVGTDPTRRPRERCPRCRRAGSLSSSRNFLNWSIRPIRAVRKILSRVAIVGLDPISTSMTLSWSKGATTSRTWGSPRRALNCAPASRAGKKCTSSSARLWRRPANQGV